MNQEIVSLRRDCAELPSVLMEGNLLRHGESWHAVPREVVLSPQGIESIIFELARPNEVVRPHFLKRWWKAIRPESLVSIGLPWVAVVLYGFSKDWHGDARLALTSLLGVIFFQVSVNVLNDVEDHLRLLDIPGSMGGSGVIQTGWLNAYQLKQFGYVTLLMGIVFGLPAVFIHPPILLFLGALGVFGVLSYSNSPFGMKYRLLGDLSIFSFLGPLLSLGFSLAIFGQWDFAVLCMGVYFGLVAWSVHFAKRLLELGHPVGIQVSRNLASQFGFKNARHFFSLIYCLAFLSLGFGVIFQSLPILIGFVPFLALPWVIQLMKRIYRASGPVSALLVPIRAESIFCQIFLGLFFCLGQILSLIFPSI